MRHANGANESWMWSLGGLASTCSTLWLLRRPASKVSHIPWPGDPSSSGDSDCQEIADSGAGSPCWHVWEYEEYEGAQLTQQCPAIHLCPVPAAVTHSPICSGGPAETLLHSGSGLWKWCKAAFDKLNFGMGWLKGVNDASPMSKSNFSVFVSIFWQVG